MGTASVNEKLEASVNKKHVGLCPGCLSLHGGTGGNKANTDREVSHPVSSRNHASCPSLLPPCQGFLRDSGDRQVLI